MTYKKEYIEVFLRNQLQLFDEPVAADAAEAAEFLEDCMAIVANNYRELKQYFEENGGDISGMTRQEVLEQAEVFALPDGKYLIVEG